MPEEKKLPLMSPLNKNFKCIVSNEKWMFTQYTFQKGDKKLLSMKFTKYKFYTNGWNHIWKDQPYITLNIYSLSFNVLVSITD